MMKLPFQKEIRMLLCGCCRGEFHQLKRHVRMSPDCLQFYKEEYNCGCLDTIFTRMKNDRRQEKRRQDRDTGIMRDRQQENMLRKRTSVRTQKRNFQEYISSLYEVYCIFCKSLNGTEKVLEDDRDLSYEERDTDYQHDGSYWICKTCQKIRSNLLNGEYLDNILEIIEEENNEDANEVVGVIQYETEDYVGTTFLPIIGDGRTNIMEQTPGKSDKDSTAMVFDHMAEIKLHKSVEKEKVAHFLDKDCIEPNILLNTLYIDVNERMKKSKSVHELNKDNVKKGTLEGGTLKIEEENTESESFLKDIKGTSAYRRKQENSTRWRAIQNGSQLLQLDKQIYSGRIQNLALAKIFLKMNDIPTKISHKDGRLNILVPCHELDVPSCNVIDCQEEHMDALAAALELYPDGRVPEENVMLVARFLEKYAEAFVNRIKKNTAEYDLRLEFRRTGQVLLRGNLWLKELQQFNKNGEKGREEIIEDPDFLKEEYTLADEPSYLEAEEKLTVELEQYLGQEEASNLRETSLLEAIFCNGRGFQMRWASQETVTFDVGNYNEEPELYRKKRKDGDEDEETFLTATQEEYVKVSTWRRKYNLRPEAVSHVTAGQMTTAYGKLDKRTKGYENTKGELKNSGGIQGQSEQEVVADFEKHKGKLKTLPKLILLRNGEVLKLKKSGSILNILGSLNHFGLRVLAEPFSSEEELRNEESLPGRAELEDRLKKIFPFSDYGKELVV